MFSLTHFVTKFTAITGNILQLSQHKNAHDFPHEVNICCGFHFLSSTHFFFDRLEFVGQLTVSVSDSTNLNGWNIWTGFVECTARLAL